MRDEHTAQWIDASGLPEDLVAAIEALGRGEHLVIARNSRPIAVISSTRAHPNERARPDVTVGEHSSPTVEDVTVVATVMELSTSARVLLSDQLGPDYIVLDVHSAPPTADVLLVPPLSPKLISYFRSLCPNARVVLAEIEDREFEISHPGPLRRLLDAGVDAYIAPGSIMQLAKQLDHTVTHLQQIAGKTSAPLEIESMRDIHIIENPISNP